MDAPRCDTVNLGILRPVSTPPYAISTQLLIAIAQCTTRCSPVHSPCESVGAAGATISRSGLFQRSALGNLSNARVDQVVTALREIAHQPGHERDQNSRDRAARNVAGRQQHPGLLSP